MDLSQITKGGKMKPPRVLVHGPAGIGKTTFGASAPSPIFLPIEDGLGKLEVDCFPTPLKYEDARNALDALVNEDHQYRSVIVDSLDWLEPLIWKHTCEKNSWPSIEHPGYGRGYVEALKYWREFLDRLNYLRDQKKMAIIMVAHTAVKRFEAPDSEGYDRYVIKLQQKASDLVSENSDCIFFAKWESSTLKVEEKGRARTRGVGKGKRIMHTEERPAWVAKNRYGLPDEMEFEWSAFMNELKGNK